MKKQIETNQEVADRLFLHVNRISVDQDGRVYVNTPMTRGWKWFSEAEYIAWRDSAQIEKY